MINRGKPYAAEFIDTAAAAGDDLRVIIREWDEGEHSFGPVRWSPAGGALPQAGDDCTVVERSDGQWTVVEWWSDSQEAGIAQAALDALDARLDALEVLPVLTAVSVFTNSWVNFDADRPARYYKDRGTVHLTGIIAAGAIGSAAFRLPSGYRPASVNGLAFPAVSNGAFGAALVVSTGVVTPITGSSTYFSLDGISFPIT